MALFKRKQQPDDELAEIPEVTQRQKFLVYHYADRIQQKADELKRLAEELAAMVKEKNASGPLRG